MRSITNPTRMVWGELRAGLGLDVYSPGAVASDNRMPCWTHRHSIRYYDDDDGLHISLLFPSMELRQRFASAVNDFTEAHMDKLFEPRLTDVVAGEGKGAQVNRAQYTSSTRSPPETYDAASASSSRASMRLVLVCRHVSRGPPLVCLWSFRARLFLIVFCQLLLSWRSLCGMVWLRGELAVYQGLEDLDKLGPVALQKCHIKDRAVCLGTQV